MAAMKGRRFSLPDRCERETGRGETRTEEETDEFVLLLLKRAALMLIVCLLAAFVFHSVFRNLEETLYQLEALYLLC